MLHARVLRRVAFVLGLAAASLLVPGAAPAEADDIGVCGYARINGDDYAPDQLDTCEFEECKGTGPRVHGDLLLWHYDVFVCLVGV